MAATTLGFGLSPYSGINANPWMLQQPSTFGQYAAQPLQQIQQLLQSVPQQLQQLLYLGYVQQQQLQQLQQVLQLIPVQIAQLQHPFASGAPTVPLWSAAPQVIGGQPGYLM